MKIGIIGLGLIGGSLACSVREVYKDCEIVALNRSEDSLNKALSDGIINKGVHEVTDDFDGCDMIFLCAPVHTNIGFLEALKPYISENTILTDVGSVKSEIHEAVARILPGAHFIGGHPMAGKEKVRFENASAQLLKGAFYYITPSQAATDGDTKKLTEFVTAIGAKPVVIKPELHDFIVAAISHVPHVAAYSLVKLVHDEDTAEEYMKYTAAGGFKDITRIASSDPTMWSQICLTNKENILKLIDRYVEEIGNIRGLIESDDEAGLYKIFDEAKQYRDSIGG